MWRLIHRIGVWLTELPCKRGQHDWGLYRPGRVMWSRECHWCGTVDFAASPDRSEVDMDRYKEYLARYAPDRETGE